MKWISVEVDPPNAHQYVIACDVEGNVRQVQYSRDFVNRKFSFRELMPASCEGDHIMDITHWMELPEPPEQK